MEPLIQLEGPAASLLRPNIDTDVIIRIERLSTISRDELGKYAFESLRNDAQFPYASPAFSQAPILLAGRNFGCGSSREGAVWALAARGVRCVIAPSFGDIFFNNCFQNGVLPIVLDEHSLHRLAEQAVSGKFIKVNLQQQEIIAPDGERLSFEIDPLRRTALLEGLDDIDLTLRSDEQIRNWQLRDQTERPWVWPSEEVAVPCTLMRGGTSKGAYFKTEDLPPPGPQRDALLRAVMGSADLLQIDGLGGSRLVTSKLAIVGKSLRADADVDYTYGIVPPGRDLVVYTSNCGNISAGVGPFAIDTGMVCAKDPVTEVRIFNTNTGKVLVAHVPVSKGKARVQGEFTIPGVPGSGAQIFMDYQATTGAKTGRLLPTNNVVDIVDLDDGRKIEISVGDAGNPCVFVRARDVGLACSVLPGAIDANATLIGTLRELRGKVAERIGLCETWRNAEHTSPALPLMVLIAPPADYEDSQGRALAADAMDLQARLVFYNKCHESMAGTGAICTAAMSAVPGTLVREATLDSNVQSRERLRIGHPLGVMDVVVVAKPGASPQETQFERLGFARTARRLMQGNAYVLRNAL